MMTIYELDYQNQAVVEFYFNSKSTSKLCVNAKYLK